MSTGSSEPLRSAVNRRQFLGRSACNAAGLAAGMVGVAAQSASRAPNEIIHVGVIGVRKQGVKLAKCVSQSHNVELHAICDVDPSVIDQARRDLDTGGKGTAPRVASDFRKLLDDPAIDAVVIATPDHSHAAIARLASDAGKDIYLESPVCHSIAEGQALAEQLDSANIVVQPGLFDRSLDHVQSAIQLIHSGQLGEIPLIKAWSVRRTRQDTLTAATAPRDVEYADWLFPRSPRPFNSQHFHRGWTTSWEFGLGELGTWGVPLLDLARWGGQLQIPTRVSAIGHQGTDVRYETPDTLNVTFAFPQSTLIWEHRNWSNHTPEGRSTGVAFHGTRGTLVVDRGGWKVYDSKTLNLTENGRSSLSTHLEAFFTRIRDRDTSSALLNDAVQSANLCHLGNLAYRLQREITPDSTSNPLANDVDANALDRRFMSYHGVDRENTSTPA